MKLEIGQRWLRICSDPSYRYIVEIIKILPTVPKLNQRATCQIVWGAQNPAYNLGQELDFRFSYNIRKRKYILEIIPNQNEIKEYPKMANLDIFLKILKIFIFLILRFILEKCQ